MPSAGNRPGACGASTEARRDVSDKSPIIDDGEKVNKNVRNVVDLYKFGRSPSDGRQCPGRSPVISHRGCIDFSKLGNFRQLIRIF